MATPSIQLVGARAAAMVNALLVMALPVWGACATIGAGGPLLSALQIVAAGAPFGALAAWRTFVYARKREAYPGVVWRGVLEAGLCGLAGALLYLSDGIVNRPTEAAPYVIVYGTAGLFLGLLVGLILYCSARLALAVWKQ